METTCFCSSNELLLFALIWLQQQLPILSGRRCALPTDVWLRQENTQSVELKSCSVAALAENEHEENNYANRDLDLVKIQIFSEHAHSRMTSQITKHLCAFHRIRRVFLHALLRERGSPVRLHSWARDILSRHSQRNVPCSSGLQGKCQEDFGYDWISQEGARIA